MGHLIVLTFLKKKFSTEKLDNSTKPKGTFFFVSGNNKDA